MTELSITISEDRSSAWVELPAGSGTLAPDQIRALLVSSPVEYGVLDEVVDAGLALEEEARRVLIASGTDPMPGTVARLELLFDSGQRVGTSSRTGQIDFRERNMVTNVRDGQPVAVWHPPRSGQPGKGVDGAVREIPESAGRETEAFLPAGDYLRKEVLSDGRIRLRSAIEGNVQYDQNAGTLKITSALEVEGDVDLSTGNIRAVGDVSISGSVCIGSKVEAQGSVVVAGAIEDAEISVGGDLTVVRGILGGDDSVITVGGNLSARHAQNVTVRAGGNVTLQEGCFSAHIEAAGDILTIEGRGQLRGGTYEAGGSIRAIDVGSESYVPTTLCAGVGAVSLTEVAELDSAVEELEQKLCKMRGESLGAEVRRMGAKLDSALATRVRTQMKLRRELLQRQIQLSARLEELRKIQSETTERPYIDVLGTAQPGVLIQILLSQRSLESKVGPVRFVLDEETGEIVLTDLPIAA
ncbi:MAG: hypothetical protein ACI841_000567 [Planctomycetota bacterium]|jgi:uncharacterized protein (DUF342 family)